MQRREFHRRVAAAALAGSCSGPAVATAQQSSDADRAEDSLPIIDTHQHLWDLSRQKLPWLDKAPEVLRRSYVTSDYLEATKGLNVVKAIYMEVDVPPSDHVAEVKLITELCRSQDHPTAAAVIGGRPGAVTFGDYIRRMAKNPYVKGVRQVLHGSTPTGFCLRETFVQSVRLLGELGLSYDLCLRPDELGDAVQLVGQCPDTQFIVDHCGNADPKAFLAAERREGAPPSHDPEAWRRNMAALAERAHVVCKISGVVAQVPRPEWSPDDLAPVVNYCLDRFGVDRVVFGSDWPVCRVGAELAQWVRALKEIVRNRPLAEQRKLFHDNAGRIYRL